MPFVLETARDLRFLLRCGFCCGVISHLCLREKMMPMAPVCVANNRVIERHDGSFGPYWRSHDFSDNTDRQNIHYLHGALHLFDAGSELKKFTWVNTGRRLTEQIREALSNLRTLLRASTPQARQALRRIEARFTIEPTTLPDGRRGVRFVGEGSYRRLIANLIPLVSNPIPSRNAAVK